MLWKTLAGLVVVIFSTIVSAAIGLFIGALIGGNFFPNFVFLGLRGYEAVGVLGLILGSILGIIAPIFLFGSRFVKRLG